MHQRALVHRPGRRPLERRGVATRRQRGPPIQQPGLPDTDRRPADLDQPGDYTADSGRTLTNVSVRTVSRSAARMFARWLRRNVRQDWLGGRAGPRRRYRWTERLATTIPSLS